MRELPLEEWRRLGMGDTDCKAMESFRERNREFYREKVRVCVNVWRREMWG